MKRKITVEPTGFDFIRATLYRRTILFFWKVEQREVMHKVYIDGLNATVEYWRQAKNMDKSQIVHKGFAGRDTVFDEFFLYLRGWYFKKLLEFQIRRANQICALQRRKVYVLTNYKGYPRAVTGQQIEEMKKKGVIKKSASAVDYSRECLYSIEWNKLPEKYKEFKI